MASLFSSSFPASGKSDWIAQVQKEAKGPDAYEQMRWQTDEGFILDPYYTADDWSEQTTDRANQPQRQVPGWLNSPAYPIGDEKATNARLRDSLTRGADALVLTVSSTTDLLQLLNGIKLSETPVFFRFSTESAGINAVDFVQMLKTIAPYQLKGGLLTNANDRLAEVTRQTADSPQFRTICVDSHLFHNAGANATQEIAFTLASLADAYDTLTEAGLSIDQLIPKTMLSVSVGTSYFMEIAKLRAFRILVARFLSYYSPTVSQSLFIQAQTSTFYDAIISPYTNLLRSTTEAMAAVIGGCDALTIHAYDAVAGKAPDPVFGERIARNISILLREESHLNKVADPSAGSYYIETLTYQLAESAWALFLTVDERGGYKQAMSEGFIRNEIDRAYQEKVSAIQQGKVLVGVTKFRENTDAVMPATEQDSYEGLLPHRRLASQFE